jgi:hypothetical protein
VEIDVERWLLKLRAREAKSLHHAQEELRMRRALGEAARLFLVDVFGESAAHIDEIGHLTERAREQDGKVAHVRRVFVPEMDEELRAREPGPGQGRVRPVLLLVHDCEQTFDRGIGMRAHDQIVSPRALSVTFSARFVVANELR